MNFSSIKATDGIYGIHEYPAILHYRVVRYLMERFGKDKKVLFDPFCGTGVSLCEALRAGKKAIGVDINPLALLIAKVRCSKPVEVPVERILKETVLTTADVPPVKNLEYWFKEDVVEKLGRLRTAIKKFKEEKFYELLLVAFSQTVRIVSNNKKNEFKRFRMKEDELKNEIAKEMLESLGYTHVETLVRQIHNKRMPLLNSPSNRIGQKNNTMKNEYMVIIRKQSKPHSK